MTPVRLVVALILGALPEVVSSDPVLGYPLHFRHRHPPPAAPYFPHHLSSVQRPPRPPASLLARAPRPRPAPGALHPLPLHAVRASRPHPGDCPAGGPWVNVTDFGAPCLRWADVPSLLERSPPEDWAPLRGQPHNFCRSPEGTGQPWCFYRNARGRGDWGYCDCGHGKRPLAAGLGRAGSWPDPGRARGCGVAGLRGCGARGGGGGNELPGKRLGALALNAQGALCVWSVVRAGGGLACGLCSARLGVGLSLADHRVCAHAHGHRGTCVLCLDQLALKAL